MYRARVVDKEAAANGDIHLDVFVESNKTGDWVLIPNGHRTLVLDGSAVLLITNSNLTDNEKVTALATLFKEEIKNWGIDKSDEATVALGELVEFPVNINL